MRISNSSTAKREDTQMVRVLVYEGTDLENLSVVIHDKTNDYNQKIFRDWVYDTGRWAFYEGHTVVMYPV